MHRLSFHVALHEKVLSLFILKIDTNVEVELCPKNNENH